MGTLHFTVVEAVQLHLTWVDKAMPTFRMKLGASTRGHTGDLQSVLPCMKKETLRGQGTCLWTEMEVMDQELSPGNPAAKGS